MIDDEEIPNSELTPEEEKRLEEEVEKKKLKTKSHYTWKALYHDTELPPIEYYIDHLLINRGTTFFGGPPGSFKTSFLLYMVAKAVLGEEVFGFKTNKPMKVLWIDEENGARVIKKKIRQICDSNEIDPDKIGSKIIFRCMKEFKINESGIRELERHINAYSVNVIVIDNVVRCFDGDENDAKDVRKLENLLKKLKEERGISFILIHHTNKYNRLGKYEISMDDIRGSGDFNGQADNVFLLNPDKYNTNEKQSAFSLNHVKCRDGMKIEPQHFASRDELKIIYLGSKSGLVKSKEGTCAMEIEDLYTGKGESIKTKEIIESMSGKFGESFVRTTLKTMVKAGTLEDKPYGSYTFLVDKKEDRESADEGE